MVLLGQSRAIDRLPDTFEKIQSVSGFCDAVIFYYMLKGAGCEAEIAEHRELDVIMEILK